MLTCLLQHVDISVATCWHVCCNISCCVCSTPCTTTHADAARRKTETPAHKRTLTHSHNHTRCMRSNNHTRVRARTARRPRSDLSSASHTRGEPRTRARSGGEAAAAEPAIKSRAMIDSGEPPVSLRHERSRASAVPESGARKRNVGKRSGTRGRADLRQPRRPRRAE